MDDDQDVHGLLRAALAAPDPEDRKCVRNGPTGLRLVEEGPYDVVLTSLELPGLDGDDAGCSSSPIPAWW